MISFVKLIPGLVRLANLIGGLLRDRGLMRRGAIEQQAKTAAAELLARERADEAASQIADLDDAIRVARDRVRMRRERAKRNSVP